MRWGRGTWRLPGYVTAGGLCLAIGETTRHPHETDRRSGLVRLALWLAADVHAITMRCSRAGQAGRSLAAPGCDGLAVRRDAPAPPAPPARKQWLRGVLAVLIQPPDTSNALARANHPHIEQESQLIPENGRSSRAAVRACASEVPLKEARGFDRDLVPDQPLVARVRIAAKVVMSADDRQQGRVCSLRK